MQVQVLTPERSVNHTEAEEVIIPTKDGILGVRTGHLPLIAPLISGELVLKKTGQADQHLAVSGGFVEVLPHEIRVLADVAEHSHELDVAEVKAAIARAQDLVKTHPLGSRELDSANAMLQHNLVRLRVAERRRHSHPHTPPSDVSGA